MRDRRSLSINTTSSSVISQIEDLLTPATLVDDETDDKIVSNTGIEHKAVFPEEKEMSGEENQENPIASVFQVIAEQNESNAAPFNPDEFKPTDENEEEEEKETDTSLPRTTCRFSFSPPSSLITSNDESDDLTENSDEAKENYRTQAPYPGNF